MNMPKKKDNQYSEKANFQVEQNELHLKILENLSEFLRTLDIQQEETLKVMLVQFAVEAVGASRGSLLIYDNISHELFYSSTFIYKNKRLRLKDYSEELSSIKYKIGENICGIAAKNSKSILVENVKNDKRYLTACDKIIRMETASLICIPIIVDRKVVAVLEITNEYKKRKLDMSDLRVLQIISNLASATMENAKLFQWAISDQLTRLYNAHYFKKQLELEIKRCTRYNRIFSMIMIDIDDFKNINDKFGHLVGDKTIRKVGHIINNTVRQGVDIAARYGGDEFIILLPETSGINAKYLAERLRKKIEHIKITNKSKNVSKITISCGISSYPYNSLEAIPLIDAADKALYKAKDTGKNKIIIYK